MKDHTLIWHRLTAAHEYVPDGEVTARLEAEPDLRAMHVPVPGKGQVFLWKPTGSMMSAPEGEVEAWKKRGFECEADPISKPERERRKIASLVRIKARKARLRERTRRAAELLAADDAGKLEVQP